MGPKTEKQAIDSVKLENGEISYEYETILRKWKDDFSNLLLNEISDLFLENTRKLLEDWEDQMENMNIDTDNNSTQNQTVDQSDILLNTEISIEELNSALKSAKANKATGIDNLPNEILKCERIKELILKLFQKCFESGTLPSMWNLSIIHPILKKGKDYRDPLSYRSISLMSTVAKIFNSLICERLTEFLDSNELLCEEQNGFRKLRSCVDHIYNLYTVLREQKNNNLPTFLCYVDFAKAFDSVNHDLLFAKLLSIGVMGKIYKVIKSMYEKLKSCVKIDDIATDWFSVERGVRQGDNLAPLLFAIFINDLAIDIKNLMNN